MRIVELHTENFMGVEAVDVSPEADVVVIGGKNGAGKSSVLNSIIAALGGKNALPPEPLRRGAENGHVRLKINGHEGDLIVERTFGEDGKSTLKVSSAEGARYPKPQQLLDALVGAVGFDPHAFIRLDAKQQAEQVRELVGLDFSEFDQQRSELYAERTAVNRSAKGLEARLAAMHHYPEAPEEEVSVAELMQQLAEAQETNRARHDAQNAVTAAEHEIAFIARQTEGVVEKIEDLKRQLSEAEESLAELHHQREQAEAEAKRLQASAEAMPSVDCDPLHEQIQNAEDTNRQVRANRERWEQHEQRMAAAEESERLTKLIEQIDAEKQKQLQSAPWPVEGLGFDEHGVTYRGLPLSQASSAEQLRVSLAMGMALNPRLRVLIIRDGSLLDDDTMEVIRAMVTENDYQLWLERVTSDGKGCSLVIKEGRVAELVA